MYYKIVTEYSFFNKLCPDMDILNIPTGSVFTAPTTNNHNNTEVTVGKSLLHFADGAFDMMLWHTKLTHHNTIKHQIYTIQPLGKITKSRCLDSLGIYQCGARKIKFLQKQNTDEMYEMALQEYFANPNKYTNFQINQDLWKKHQTTIFSLYNSYEDSLPKKKHPPIPLKRLLKSL